MILFRNSSTNSFLSKTINLRNEITNFQQHFDESFSEAWDRFKDLLIAYPHHGFSELHQLDTFYNALNSKDQDSLNSAVGVVAKVSTNTSIFDISPDVAELKYMVKALLIYKKSQNQALTTVKAVKESCVTYGGAHSYRNCPATDGNVYRDNIQEFVSQASAVNYNQGNTSYHPPMMSNQIRPPGFPPVPYNRNVQLNQRNNQNRFNQNQNRGKNFNLGPVYQPPCLYFELGTLPSNTIANPISDLKAITTQSGVSYDGPQILPPPSFLPKVVENKPEATKDTVQPTNNGSTEDVQPQVVQSESQILNSESITSLISKPVIALIFKDMSFEISFTDALILMPKFASTLKALIGNKEKLSEMARTPMAECLALVDIDASINLMPRSVWKRLSLPDLTPTCMTLELADRLISHLVGVAEDVYVKVGSFHFPSYFVVVDFDADPRVPLILERSFLKTRRALIDVFEGELTLRVGKKAISFNLDQTSRYSANYIDMTAKRIDVIDMACEDDFLLEEVDAFLAIEDYHTSPEVDQSYLDHEGDILQLEAFLIDDPSLSLPTQGNYLPGVRKELKICKAKSDKSSIDEPPEVELKELPPHLDYAFLEGDDKFPVIIAKDLSVEEETALITILKSHKRAIA
nr:hypothetical protein [Tanacetum cinerariifolium]